MNIRTAASSARVHAQRHGVLLASCALSALFVLSYGSTLRQWWLWDDPQLLFASLHSFRSLFFDPATWRAQSAHSFVPFLMADYRVDRLLFGFEPWGYYLHAVVIGALAVLSVFSFLRAVASDFIAFIATAAILLAPTSQGVFTLLMDRHYSEGLLFFALSLLCFLKSEKRPALYPLASVFYFIAALEKEVFVPLPLLALALAWLSQNRRVAMVRTLLATSIPAAVYLLWRVLMLGSMGGYGPSGGLLKELAKFNQVARTSLTFDSWIAPLLLISIGLVHVFCSRNRAFATCMVLILAAAVIVPLTGVREVFDDRYVFAATSLLVGTSAVAAAHSESVISRWSFSLLVAAVIIAGLTHRGDVLSQRHRMMSEGRLVWQGTQRHPAFLESNLWYIDGVRWLRASRRSDASPRGFGSLQAVVLSGVDPKQIVVSWNGRFVRANRQWLEQVQRVRGSFMPDRDLLLEIRRSESLLQWEIESPGASEFWLLSGSTGEATPLPSGSGWMRLPNSILPPTSTVMPETQWFIVVASDGRSWTASPRLRYPRTRDVLRWQRKSGGRSTVVRDLSD